MRVKSWLNGSPGAAAIERDEELALAKIRITIAEKNWAQVVNVYDLFYFFWKVIAALAMIGLCALAVWAALAVITKLFFS